jgi:hypothetical protein
LMLRQLSVNVSLNIPMHPHNGLSQGQLTQYDNPLRNGSMH